MTNSGERLPYQKATILTAACSVKPTTDVALDNTHTLAELEAAIWAIPYRAGATDTSSALMAINNMFTSPGSADVPKLGYVITDGQSTINSVFTKATADLLKNAGVTMFTIGK